MKHFHIFLLILFLTGCLSSVEPEGTIVGTVTDIDGNEYKTVKIGEQVWMAENLKVTRYRNGDPIPNIVDNSEWNQLTTGAYSHYWNDPFMTSTYGLYYNWYVVDDKRGLCPDGWQVATRGQWQNLVNTAGGSSEGGGRMKTTGTIQNGNGLWRHPNTGASNSLKFSGLPADRRLRTGAYQDSVGYYAYFWTSTAINELKAYEWRLFYGSADVGLYEEPYDTFKKNGYSIRCIKVDN